MRPAIICFGCLLLLTGLPVHGQSQDSGSTGTPAKPADPQTQGTASTAQKKPKKVWTNDEIGSVKGDISVVGDPSARSTPGQRKTGSPSGGSMDQGRRAQIENYRNQIQQYQSRIDAIDQRIAQLKNFKADNSSPSGGININEGYNMVPIEDQVKQLEAKKKELQAKIEDTENEARKNGIESGDLR
jgi:hypothetical protein